MNPHSCSSLPQRFVRRIAAIAAVALALAWSLPARADTAAVVNATNAFLATLSSSQQTAVKYDFTSANAKIWSNLPVTMSSRNGLAFSTLSQTQLNAVLAVAQAALSTEGYTLLAEIRAADDILAGPQPGSYGAGKYYIAILGTPSTSSTWMLQIGGHHIAYNITYNGNAVSASPFFIGVEPRTWTASGVTHAPLAAMSSSMINLGQALSPLSAAKLTGTFDDIVNGANSGGHDGTQTYPTGTTGRGVLVSSLTSAQRDLVKVAMEAWVDRFATDVADTLLLTYESDSALAQTYVAYAGTVSLDSRGYYLRIDGPRCWIEFCVNGGIVFSDVHYHSIYRDKTADYGGSFSASSTSTTTTTTTSTTTPTTTTTTTGTSTTSAASSSGGGGGGAPSVWFLLSVAGVAALRGRRLIRTRHG
jgi:hypothetical protein